MYTDFALLIKRKIPQKIAQLYSNLMPIQCLLCGQRSSKDMICSYCVVDLPKLGSVCEQCAMPIPHPPICGRCLSHPPAFDVAFSLYPYHAPVDRLISDMKYHGQLALCHFFSQQLIRELTSRPHPKLLLPIPLHPKRLKERGFNQSWEITKSLSKALKIDTNASILVRSKDTKPQATLPYSERKKNLHGAFSLTTIQLPDHIALIDDVLTTGHTAQEAAKCLKKVGVKRVELWTIARSIGHD